MKELLERTCELREALNETTKLSTLAVALASIRTKLKTAHAVSAMDAKQILSGRGIALTNTFYLGHPEAVEACYVLSHVVAPVRVGRVVRQVPLFRSWEVPVQYGGEGEEEGIRCSRLNSTRYTG